MTPEDQQLLESFCDGSIPLERWNQRTHVSIAYLYLREWGFDEALERLRGDIQEFNRHHEIEESPKSGYNETTTVALLRLIDTVMKEYERVFPTASADEFCDTHPQLMSKHVLRFYYSPERRMQPEAKVSFVEPDLAPLPGTWEGGGKK